MQEKVESLVTKAEKAETADDALKFSQAALNASKALRELRDTKALGDK